MPARIEAATAARELLDTRYRGATAIFLTGSAAGIAPTGGALVAVSEHSDLDLTAVIETASPAFLEAFRYKDWPVEALVTDSPSLRRTLAAAPALGECSVPSHIVDAIVLPGPSAAATALQDEARRVIDAGPARLGEREHRHSRHAITRLVREVEAERSAADRIATGAVLLPRLAHYHLRAANRWSAKPAFLSRRLRDEDPELARRFFAAFRALLAADDPAPVGALVDELLAPHGGRLFDGFRG